jgi:hypothetical protein
MGEQRDETQNNDAEMKKKAFTQLLESVAPSDFFRFLDAKDVTTTCPGCKKDGLQVTAISGKQNLKELLNGEEANSFVTYFRLEPGHAGDTDHNYYYKSFCENCGYITMHAVTPVLQWLQSEAVQREAEDV